MASPPPSPEALDGLYDVIFNLLRSGDRRGIPTAVDHAYAMIWRQLIGRERQPGERLTDTELAAQLGLSRTPVRQALHLLARDELVRFDARRGFSVKVFSAEDVREIYDVRSALEVLAVRLAAPHLASGQLEDRVRRLHEVRSVLRSAGDQHAIILALKADLELHNLIIQASGNGRLIRTLGALRSQQSLFQYWDTSYPQRNQAAADEHERILQALIAGDTAAASRSMAEHINNARDRVLTDLFHVPASARSEPEPTTAGAPLIDA